MSQLAKFSHTAANSSTGLPVGGCSVTIYREGATINGSQAGTSPLNLTVRDIGKIAVGDTVFVGTDTATTYIVNSISSRTALTLGGFTGTLSVADRDRLIPYNDKPTIYYDDQGAASTTNPLTTSSTGLAECYIEFGAYDYVVSGGGINASVYEGYVASTENPGQIRYADDYAGIPTTATGGIQEALDDLSSTGGVVWLSPKTYDQSDIIYIPSNTTLCGSGVGASIIKAGTNMNANSIRNNDQTSGNTNITLRDLTVDGNQSNQSSNDGPIVNFKRCSGVLCENIEVKNGYADGIYIQSTTGAVKRNRVVNCYVHDCNIKTATNGHGSITLYTSGGYGNTQAIISGNIIENGGLANGTSGLSLHGIYCAGGNQDEVIVSDNVIYNEYGNGITLSTIGNANVTGNYIKTVGTQNVTNGGNGIFATTTTYGRAIIIGNTIDGVAANSDNGIEVSGTGTDILIMGNRCSNVANAVKAGIFIAHTGCTCTGNICNNNTGFGIYAATSTGSTFNGLTISSNACMSNGAHGIAVRGYGQLTVNGNTCDSNTQCGIYISEGLTVSGAEILDLAISGNVCRGNTQEGLYISGESVGAAGQLARRIAISGNSLNINTLNGLNITSGSGVAINGNVMSGNTSDGIEFGTSLVDCTIDGNIIRDNGGYGINVNGITPTRLIVGHGNLFQNNTSGNTTAAAGTPTLAGATPDASGVINAVVTNGGATTVTDITGGFDGRIINLYHTDGNTTYTDGTNIFLHGSTNYNPGATDMLSLVRIGGKWYEVTHSDN